MPAFVFRKLAHSPASSPLSPKFTSEIEVETPEFPHFKETSPSTGVWEALLPASLSASDENMRSNCGGQACVFKEHQLLSDPSSVSYCIYWFCMLKLFCEAFSILLRRCFDSLMSSVKSGTSTVHLSL